MPGTSANLNFHVPADFTPVATISRGAGVLVVNPSVPVTTVPELIAYANGNPRKVTVASAGVGSAPTSLAVAGSS